MGLPVVVVLEMAGGTVTWPWKADPRLRSYPNSFCSARVGRGQPSGLAIPVTC